MYAWTPQQAKCTLQTQLSLAAKKDTNNHNHTNPMETRSMEKGAPLKKPGAYNTDLYYQEKDEGFGDVGVDQEPDAGTLDDRGDPDFKVAAQEMEEGDRVQAKEDESMPVDDTNVQEEVADLKPTAAGEEQVDERGEPVPVVQDTPDEVEANEAGYTMAP